MSITMNEGSETLFGAIGVTWKELDILGLGRAITGRTLGQWLISRIGALVLSIEKSWITCIWGCYVNIVNSRPKSLRVHT